MAVIVLMLLVTSELTNHTFLLSIVAFCSGLFSLSFVLIILVARPNEAFKTELLAYSPNRMLNYIIALYI